MQRLARSMLAASLMLSSYVFAQTTNFQPNVTVLQDNVVYNVNADGTYVKDEIEAFRINTEQAVSKASQVPLRFSPDLQDWDVVEAYTTTKDGKRIDVAPDKIVVQQSPESANAPMFDDNKVKNVVFPDVEVGSTLTIHARKIQKKALFPGQFSTLETFSTDFEHQSVHIVVNAPASLKLYVDAVDLKGGQVTSDKPGMQRWEWSLENQPAHAPELGSVGAIDHSPRLAVTTFPSYEAIGAAYLDRAKSKAAVTPAIQQLADTLTDGVNDKRKQAEILYNWVSTHIRYVAIYLDFGGVVPHDAQSILDAKYGDCKDHVTLLEALLAAKGIQSSPVLVNAAQTYWIPKAASPDVFDHAITYLPEFKLFVDSTAQVARFGTLALTELGKQAVIADDGTGAAKLVTLPVANPDSDKVTIMTTLTIDSSGDVKGTSEVSNSGVYDWLSREIFASLPPGMESQFADYVLKNSGQDGTGNYKHGDLHDLTKAFDFETHFKLPNYAQLPGPGAMVAPLGLSSFSNIASTFEAFGPETRDFAMPLVSRNVSETIQINLPDNMKVPNLPKPADITSQFGSYRSSYAANGQTITVTRVLNIALPGPLLQPEQYPEFRKMALAVMHDLRTQLVY